MSGNCFFNPIPSHSHRLFPFPRSPIPVLLVISQQITNDRKTQQCAEQFCYKKNKINQVFKNAHAVCLINIQSKTNRTVYDKLRCKNKRLLTVSDDQLPVGGNGKVWSFHQLPFPPSHSHSHSHETSLAIFIPMGIPSINLSLTIVRIPNDAY